MGYEISATESSPRANKCPTARSLVPRKDSPLRLKQTKLKLTSTDAEKSITENDAQSGSSTEAAMEMETNESFTRISETYSEAMDIDEPGESAKNDNVVEANSHTKNGTADKPAQEVKTAVDSSTLCVSENQQLSPPEILQNSVPISYIGTQDSETQQDIFDGMDAKNNIAPIEAKDDEMDTSIQNNSTDSIKLNVTNDSVMEALPTKEDNLEDTVDIQNITELNSTVNSDEIFCGKLLHTSTHVTENVAEQDTLPVTDSVFASLPSIQDSRDENQNNAKLDPEFLDSTRPIYPTLTSCQEPVDAIIEQLTNPLWIHNLSLYFANRSLRTIGDLAQLSEREVHRIPVKGKPKIEFVRKVLQHFESTSLTACKSKRNLPTCVPQQANTSDEVEQSSAAAIDEGPGISAASTLDSIEASASLDGESLSCSTPQSTEKTLGNLSTEKSTTEQLDRTESTSSDICSMDTSDSSESRNSGLSASVASTANGQTSAKVPTTVHGLPGISTDDAKLVPLATSSTCASTYVIIIFRAFFFLFDRCS